MIRKALEHTQLWSWIYTSDSVNLAENYLYLLSGSLSSIGLIWTYILMFVTKQIVFLNDKQKKPVFYFGLSLAGR